MLLEKLNEMPWYKMSIKNKLAYAHILNRLQHGTVVKMGPFEQLNLDTFTKVKNINQLMNTFYDSLNKLIISRCRNEFTVL